MFNRNTSTIDFTGAVTGNINGTATTNFHNIRMYPGGGINFFTGSSQGRLSGTLELRPGSFVTGFPPIYEVGSKLRYAGGGTFNRNLEWDNTTLQKVEVTNNTTLYAAGGGNANAAYPATMADSLIIQSGSVFTMSNMTAALNVGTSLELKGTLTLSTNSTSDMFVGGDWVNNGGTFTSNDRLITFNGTADAAVKGPSTTTFPFMTVNKSIAKTLTWQNAINLTRTGGTALRVQGGILNMNNNTPTLNAGSTLRIDSGFAAGQTVRTGGASIAGFTNYRRSSNPVDSLGGKVDYSGTGSETCLNKGFNLLSVTNGTTLTVGNSLRVADSLIVGTGSTIDFTGNLNVVARGNVYNRGTITANNGATLWLNGTSAQAMAGNGNYGRVVINNASNVSSANMPTISEALTLYRGKLISGNNAGDTVVLGTTATLTESIVDSANQHFVRGAIKTIRTVGSGSGINNYFGGLGVGMTPGVDNLGNVTVVRFSGAAVSGQNPSTCCTGHQGINRYWIVKPTNQPTAPDRDVVFQWPSQEDNSQLMTSVTLWKSPDGIVPYSKFGAAQNATTVQGSSGQIRAGWIYNIGSFSHFTFADDNNFLPLGLLRFTGANVQGVAQLNWVITNQKAWTQFVVERSADGRSFGPVGSVRAQANGRSTNTYVYADRGLVQNTYYRLRMIDADGKVEYSQAVYLTVQNAVARMVAFFPNPATASAELAIDGQTDLQEGVQVDVVGIDGRTVYSLEGTLEEVNHTLPSQVQAMPKGMYQVRITLSDSIKTLKFIKQ
jgi:hypothetical protein